MRTFLHIPYKNTVITLQDFKNSRVYILLYNTKDKIQITNKLQEAFFSFL